MLASCPVSRFITLRLTLAPAVCPPRLSAPRSDKRGRNGREPHACLEPRSARPLTLLFLSNVRTASRFRGTDDCRRPIITIVQLLDALDRNSFTNCWIYGKVFFFLFHHRESSPLYPEKRKSAFGVLMITDQFNIMILYTRAYAQIDV